MEIKAASIAWVVALIGLLGYELFAIIKHHTTLSQAVWTVTSTEYGPALPFLVGFLMGHFFFSGK